MHFSETKLITAAPPPPNNYYKVTRYGPEPNTGRRTLLEERFFFFNDTKAEQVERARAAATGLASTWSNPEEGVKVTTAVFNVDEFPKVATLDDREVRPIFVRYCRLFACPFPAFRGTLCHDGHPGMPRAGRRP